MLPEALKRMWRVESDDDSPADPGLAAQLDHAIRRARERDREQLEEVRAEALEKARAELAGGSDAR